jgi:hypothetical protein
MSTRERTAGIAVALTIGLVLTGNAAAQGLTIDSYRRPNSQTELDFNKGYLTGLKDGLIAYNMTLDDKLFCLTGEIPTLSFDQANDLTMSWARKRGPDSGGTAIPRALLTALRERYPCRAGAR